MATGRIELHFKLVELLGSNNVYFQPPSTVKLSYPCIIYKRDTQSDHRADNRVYHMQRGYLVTVITADPDSNIPDKMMTFQYSSFSTHFTADNLNHYVYSIYY